MNPAVRFDHVTRTYGRGAAAVAALRDVTLAIPPGRTVAVLGRSGSGKSTLLNLAGAVDVPSRGRIDVLGRDLSTLSAGERALLRRRDLGFVFQQFRLVSSLSVFDNAATPWMLDGDLTAARAEGVDRLLERLGLEGKARRHPDELSGGQQQRVAIARALARGPRIVLADEPTGNLDVETGRVTLDLLDELRGEYGFTLLLATHSAEAADRCEARITLEDGRITEASGLDAASSSGLEAEGAGERANAGAGAVAS